MLLIVFRASLTISDPRADAGVFREKDLEEEEALMTSFRKEVAYCDLLLLARFSKTPRTSSEVTGLDVSIDAKNV